MGNTYKIWLEKGYAKKNFWENNLKVIGYLGKHTRRVSGRWDMMGKSGKGVGKFGKHSQRIVRKGIC